jgi:hypothetical protein
MHLKPTVGCQISTLIFGKNCGGGTCINIPRTLPSLIYFSWDIYRDPPPQFFFKYQSWYLTPCCGLEVHYPTKALTSVKDPSNTFNLNTKWAKTLLSLIYFSWDIHRDPPPQFSTFDMWIESGEGGLYKYPMKYISRTAKFLPTWGIA